MHIIYQTEGIVLDKKDYGEANRLFCILTEKFGLIRVMAQGVRNVKSKLRYSLNLFAQGDFCFVKGKDFWRIIDAQELKEVKNDTDFNFPENEKSLEKLLTFKKLSSLLARMIKGEEKNEFIWKEVKNFFDHANLANVSGSELSDLETITVAKILHNLGYMAEDPSVFAESKQKLVTVINRALKESML